MADPRELIFNSLNDFLIDTIGPEKFNSFKTILEFGCGKNGFAGDYKLPHQRAIGVDLHEQFREPWAARGVEYLISDGDTIPVESGSIDLIVTHSVVEHVADLPNSLREFDRVLKVRGYAYITVSPLYYAPQGAHIRTLPDWEHLRPGSKYYLMDQPIDRMGAYLNKLTMSELLKMIGALPWNIVRMDRKILATPIPAWLTDYPPLDLLTREFRIVLQKQGFKPTFE